MPIEFVRTQPPPPAEGEFVKIATPEASIPSGRAEVEDLRNPAIWNIAIDKSYAGALEKLKRTIRVDLAIYDIDVDAIFPCIVDEKEGGTQVEQRRIAHIHRKMSKLFAKLIDRLIRFQPEYRPDAVDAVRQDLIDFKVMWKPFECDKFRAPPLQEAEPKKKRKKKQ